MLGSGPSPVRYAPWHNARLLQIGDRDQLRAALITSCLHAVAPQGRPWMWASGHGGHVERAAHGYEPTREAAMAVR
jgi:hypothetical protein